MIVSAPGGTQVLKLTVCAGLLITCVKTHQANSIVKRLWTITKALCASRYTIIQVGGTLVAAPLDFDKLLGLNPTVTISPCFVQLQTTRHVKTVMDFFCCLKR